MKKILFILVCMFAVVNISCNKKKDVYTKNFEGTWKCDSIDIYKRCFAPVTEEDDWYFIYDEDARDQVGWYFSDSVDVIVTNDIIRIVDYKNKKAESIFYKRLDYSQVHSFGKWCIWFNKGCSDQVSLELIDMNHMHLVLEGDFDGLGWDKKNPESFFEKFGYANYEFFLSIK